jgi:hypothetical protein
VSGLTVLHQDRYFSAGIAELLAARDGSIETNADSAPAQILAARLSEVRQSVAATAEELHRAAAERAGRVREELETFDRQSEGALSEASVSVEMARSAVRKSQGGGSTPTTGDRLAQLEATLMIAQQRELEVLRERVAGREPLELAWRVAAAEVVTWGGMLLRVAGEPVLHSLTIHATPASEALARIEIRNAVAEVNKRLDAAPNGVQP